MSGPNKSDRETLGDLLKSRNLWSEAFALLVGIGLTVEYWRDIVDCFVHWHLPRLPLIGGIMVTVGVFGEVLFSRLALKTSDELQKRADSDVAQANERAAQALDHSANADLERVRLEKLIRRRTVTRQLDNDEEVAAIDALRKHAGQRFAVRISESEDEQLGIRRNAEKLFFASQLQHLLIAAGWQFENTATLWSQEVRKGVTIFSLGNTTSEAAAALGGTLNRLNIYCALSFVRESETITPLVIGLGSME